jgi:hypothetical protein
MVPPPPRYAHTPASAHTPPFPSDKCDANLSLTIYFLSLLSRVSSTSTLCTTLYVYLR